MVNGNSNSKSFVLACHASRFEVSQEPMNVVLACHSSTFEVSQEPGRFVLARQAITAV